MNEIYPAFTAYGRKYYNITKSAEYAGYTTSGFKRKIDKLEIDHGINIPLVSRGGLEKCIDARILDHFRKPMFVGHENEWYDEMRYIIQQIGKENNEHQ